jgi:hypothetical protein
MRRQIRSIAARDHGTEFDIVAHGKLGKNVAALRHVTDTCSQQLALAQARHVAPLENDSAFAQSELRYLDRS